MRKMTTLLLCAALASAGLLGYAQQARAARVKDVATIRGVRANQLIGYGLVVGLKGTGDDQQVYFTLRSVQLMLRRLGVQAANENKFDLRNLRLRNTAAVMVTAELPPFAKAGSRLDVTVSSIGNAKSLEGGTLLLTPLRGVNLKIYSLAQGPMSVGGGFTARGRSGSRAQRNHTTVARIPRGALVEREVKSRFVHKNKLMIALRRPDFTTARRLAVAVNKVLPKVGKKKDELAAVAKDPASVVVTVPKKYLKKTVELASKLELVQVRPDAPAQVIINERTGTVVVGRAVKLSPVAVSHGALTLEVDERFKVSQPRAFGRGRTAVVPDSRVKVTEGTGKVKLLQGGVSPSDVVKALNALGASPRDLVAIFQAIERAGALNAKLVVQ
jgi:flagellar P-ring protein precursor FlgI